MHKNRWLSGLSKAIAITALTYFSSLSFSAEMKFLHLISPLTSTNNKCELFESGAAELPNPFIVKGQWQDIDRPALRRRCYVYIPAAEFKARFQFCAVSSVSTQDKATGTCEFAPSVKSDKEKGYSFSVGPSILSEDADVMCNFVCMTK
jgi:hypothetical protein